MIYEVRTYRLKPGTMGTFLTRYEEAYRDRLLFSEICASFTTDIGPQEQIVNIWPYESHAHREEIRRESHGVGKWPPRSPDIMAEMHSQIFVPMPFCPEFPAGNLGPVFEWRTYQIRTDGIPDIADVWGEIIDRRREISPLVMAMHSENGVLNTFVHIWAYESLAHRADARAEAVRVKAWPPRSAPAGTILSQENRIMTPTSFSPLK